MLGLVEVVGGLEDHLSVADAIDWRMSDPIENNGTFVLTASRVGSGETIQAELPRAWQNFLRAGDVNNDGNVTAADALRIINELSRREFSDSDTQDLDDPLTVAAWPGDYFDHNGDQRVTALDALRVINDLARLSLNNGSEEAESLEELSQASLTSLMAPSSDESASSEQPSDCDSGLSGPSIPTRSLQESIFSAGAMPTVDLEPLGGEFTGDDATNRGIEKLAVDHLLSDQDLFQELFG